MAYIDTEKLKRNIRVNLMPNVDIDGTITVENAERHFLNLIDKTSTADVVEVVRCKDCKHFQPKFVLTNNGERRPYTEEEIENGCIVTGDKGINCGSRCERYGYWEVNRCPVWCQEDDFCSYGERRDT